MQLIFKQFCLNMYDLQNEVGIQVVVLSNTIS